jgi:16S rRNA (guanine(966)-N(2))-methyltransferase RsmD
MRIIAGKYKGRHIYSSKNQSIRPTTDRIKEYIFDILNDFIKDCRVLDLFSGSGSLGLESLSRGASHVTFVDIAYSSIKVLKKNINRIKLNDNYEIVQKNALTFLRQNKQSFDLIFADPPFKWNHYIELLPLAFLKENLNEYGLFVLESERTHEIEWETNIYEVIRQKKYDRSLITFFGRKESK